MAATSSENLQKLWQWQKLTRVSRLAVHDVDHTGVPNAQLVKEKAYVARTYNNKSVAEQVRAREG